MQETVDSEWESFARAQRGDGMAWGVLVARHRARLAALALFVTGSAEAADEVVQETFVRALRARIRDTSGTVRGFLGTIAYRLAVKETARVRRNVELDRAEHVDGSRDALERVLADERDRLVAGAIAALDAGHRDVLVLRFYGGHSYEEIAESLGVPLGTVKSRIFYAVKSCRETLRERGATS
ncbi:MAG: RNA polymerase sigma factor [Candidatus Eisenbacteria bacterium]|nr:RNA polymerase sigma factor [Candidatus Eisenbacteria bacterium]